MGIKSRNKGAVGEREIVDLLNGAGMLARRTVQYCGNSGDSADVVLDGVGVHIEVKRTERISIRPWLEQVTRDSKGKPWILFYRGSQMRWLVIVSAELVPSNTSGHALESHATAHTSICRDAVGLVPVVEKPDRMMSSKPSVVLSMIDDSIPASKFVSLAKLATAAVIVVEVPYLSKMLLGTGICLRDYLPRVSHGTKSDHANPD